MNFPELINTLLETRNLSPDPKLQDFAPLASWPGIHEVAHALADSIESGETICIWGDYDVDGVTSTAVALQIIRDIRKLNGLSPNLLWHIPDRFFEGYGVNLQALPEIAADGAKTVVTVDCGITAHDAVEEIRCLGMKAIITDHHLPDENIPDCPVCDPSLKDTAFKEGLMLAGVGTIYVSLIAASNLLRKRGFKIPDMRQWLDLVALGTVADVADLGGQNRILVKNGLSLLSEATRPGIAALKIAGGIPPKKRVDTETIAFSLAPMINAAGRMRHAGIALNLLMSEDQEKATAYAQELASLNRLRRDEENRIAQEAIQQGLEQVKNGARAILAYSPNWHQGIVGIAASRVTEHFNLPSLVCCMADGSCKGSGRSIEGINLYDALKTCEAWLDGFGGHAMAAGIHFPLKNLQKLRAAFSNAIPETVSSQNGREADATWDLPSITMLDIMALDIMEPTGAGNPPLLLEDTLVLYDFALKGGLLTMTLRNDDTGAKIRAKKWRPNVELTEGDIGRRMHIWATPRLSSFGGAANIEFDIDRWEFE